MAACTLGDWAKAGDGGCQFAPAPAHGCGEHHAIKKAADRGVGSVEIPVGVQPGPALELPERPPHVCASNAACDFVSTNATTRASSCGIKRRAIVRPFCRIRREHASWKTRVDLFCLGVCAIESRRDTAVAVAQIFSVASRKFRSPAASAVYPAQNRLQSDGTTRALGEVSKDGRKPCWRFALRK
jgi:hypothetical protein